MVQALYIWKHNIRKSTKISHTDIFRYPTTLFPEKYMNLDIIFTNSSPLLSRKLFIYLILDNLYVKLSLTYINYSHTIKII